jgi:beta-fructofuranosidase
MYTIEKANQFIKQNSSRVESKYRQKIHLQPPLGWMNDPNGFITIGEEIHLFYQYYPYDSIWGPMHWGHAVTRNGISWQYLPVALAPDQKYDEKGCFSGTAILNQEKLLLMYTGGMTEGEQDVQQQCIATSTDYRTFQKVKSNPIISNKNIPEFLFLKDFRDPKIIKRENQFYALVVTKTENNTGSIVLFESHDAVQWVYKSVVLTSNNTFGEMWECPDLLEINGKDILFFSAINMPNQQEKYKNISSCLYFVGSMDWEAGTYTYDFFDEIDAGLDFYAPQTAVLPDGSPLLIAWMQMWDRNIPTHELGHHWAGCMTVIRRLSLINNTLFQKPYIPLNYSYL